MNWKPCIIKHESKSWFNNQWLPMTDDDWWCGVEMMQKLMFNSNEWNGPNGWGTLWLCVCQLVNAFFKLYVMYDCWLYYSKYNTIYFIFYFTFQHSVSRHSAHCGQDAVGSEVSLDKGLLLRIDLHGGCAEIQGNAQRCQRVTNISPDRSW